MVVIGGVLVRAKAGNDRYGARTRGYSTDKTMLAIKTRHSGAFVLYRHHPVTTAKSRPTSRLVNARS